MVRTIDCGDQMMTVISIKKYKLFFRDARLLSHPRYSYTSPSNSTQNLSCAPIECIDENENIAHLIIIAQLKLPFVSNLSLIYYISHDKLPLSF